jgi:hypothetical protein
VQSVPIPPVLSARPAAEGGVGVVGGGHEAGEAGRPPPEVAPRSDLAADAAAAAERFRTGLAEAVKASEEEARAALQLSSRVSVGVQTCSLPLEEGGGEAEARDGDVRSSPSSSADASSSSSSAANPPSFAVDEKRSMQRGSPTNQPLPFAASPTDSVDGGEAEVRAAEPTEGASVAHDKVLTLRAGNNVAISYVPPRGEEGASKSAHTTATLQEGAQAPEGQGAPSRSSGREFAARARALRWQRASGGRAVAASDDPTRAPVVTLARCDGEDESGPSSIRLDLTGEPGLRVLSAPGCTLRVRTV